MSEDVIEVYQFRPNPGPRERHLKRKHRNPLFVDAGVISQKAVNEARQADLDELESFTESLQKMVQEAVSLPANAESDVILALKERADRLYEQGSGLGGKLDAELGGIRKLTEVIMAAVRKGAGVDQTALSELDQETQARAAHYDLLQHSLVADLLRPDSPIERDDLVPSLLSGEPTALQAALGLFDADQLASIITEAEALLARVERSERAVAALELMREAESQSRK